jgi:hypothetical protein
VALVAARIRDPHVVATVDIVNGEGELFLVMEYVEGESFSMLLRLAREAGARVPVGVAASVVAQALHGLHAAHEAKNDLGEPLHLVHRDVSPQNVLVGTDGVARVLDFGVAKALGKLHTTREGQLKGKLGYLAPEQVLGHPVTRCSDVFAAAVVLWEALVGERLFASDSEGNVLRRIMDGIIDRPSQHVLGVPAPLEAVVMKGLAREPVDRYETALAMAEAIEGAVTVAAPRDVAQWLNALAADRLRARAQLVAAIESGSAAAPTDGGAHRAAARSPELARTLVDDAEKAHTSGGGRSGESPASAPAFAHMDRARGHRGGRRHRDGVRGGEERVAHRGAGAERVRGSGGVERDDRRGELGRFGARPRDGGAGDTAHGERERPCERTRRLRRDLAGGTTGGPAPGAPSARATGGPRRPGAERHGPLLEGVARRVPRAACGVPRAACRVPRDRGPK